MLLGRTPFRGASRLSTGSRNCGRFNSARGCRTMSPTPRDRFGDTVQRPPRGGRSLFHRHVEGRRISRPRGSVTMACSCDAARSLRRRVFRKSVGILFGRRFSISRPVGPRFITLAGRMTPTTTPMLLSRRAGAARSLSPVRNTDERLQWSPERESNPRPTHYECVALPTELSGRTGERC
jgi:hypothetical protein